jgi:hypothetical protein
MYLDTSLKDVLNSKNVTMIVGIPRTRVQLTGTIDGNNKDFTLSAGDYPIYPARGMSLTPQPADVTVETLKGTTYTGSIVVDSIGTITDSDTGDLVYGKVTLHTAPEAAAVDSVHLTFYEALRPYVAQSLKIDIKQDSTEVGELGSEMKRTSYAGQTITVSQDSIFADFDVDKKLLFETYSGGYDVETGYDAYTLITEPATRLVCIPMYTGAANDAGGTFLGAYYFNGKIVPKSLGDVKDGDNMTRSLEFSVDSTPTLVVPE